MVHNPLLLAIARLNSLKCARSELFAVPGDDSMLPAVLRAVGFAAALALYLASGGAAFAQQNQTVPQTLAPLVDQAKIDGMTVVIIAPEAKPAEPAAEPQAEGMTDIGLQIRNEVKRLVTSAKDIPGRVVSALEVASPDGTTNWFFRSVAVAISAISAGLLLAWWLERSLRKKFRYLYNPEPRDRAEKINFLCFVSLLRTLTTALLLAVAMLVAILFDTGHIPSRQTGFVIIAAFVAGRFLPHVIFFYLLAPGFPNHRMINLTTDAAVGMHRDLTWAIGIAVATFGLSEWMRLLDVDGDALKLLLIASTFLAAILIGLIAIRYREAFAGAVLGAGDPADKPAWRRFLAGGGLVFGLLYLATAVAVTAVRVVLGLPSATMLVAAPAIALVSGITAYGAFLVGLEWFYRARQASHARKMKAALEAALRKRQHEEAAREEAYRSNDVDESENVIEHRAAPLVVADAVLDAVFRPVFKPLLEQAVGILVTIVAIGFVLGVWDVRAGERGNPVTGFMDILMVMFIAWFLYQAVNVFIDRKLADEGIADAPNVAEIDDEAAAHSYSRLGTLLPLLRMVLTSAIVAIAGMIVFSGLGIDVAPLFAGAGVVGLAVGFGAQSMIRDIFSGAFFLFDDAFRKGEYVELGDLVGTVEKISLRSFQLRHHNGPLHTVPFGEIKQLTNHSRDWVIMKLPLRLEFDVDLEKVRKILKKLGQELLAHPEVGKNFLQPLKSQGVIEIDDSALVLRVKFMTRPDDQWITRKVVYASIQELFKRNGIRFANREVTVRISGEGVQANDAAVKQAASAAARSVLDAEARKLALPVKKVR